MDPHLLAQHSEMEESHWWLAARKLIIASVLKRWANPRPNQRLLDVGCGAGSMVGTLAEYGNVTALDASETAIGYVHKRYPDVTTAVGEITDPIPALRGPFDVVTALDVIEHITDDLGALTTIRDRMAPGGLLVCAVPAFQWLWGPHDELSGHKRRYNKRGLVNVLGAAGFTVEWVSYYNTMLFPAVAALRVARRILRPNAPAASDFDVKVGPLNWILLRLFAVERHVLRRVRLPIGVSIVAVAHNPA